MDKIVFTDQERKDGFKTLEQSRKQRKEHPRRKRQKR